MRLGDLGGGEPNDDLTWALFDERADADSREPEKKAAPRSKSRAPSRKTAEPRADAPSRRSG